jgi:hypothetical protein
MEEEFVPLLFQSCGHRFPSDPRRR